MTNIDKLKEIINNRVVCIVLHGKSVEGLEQHIESLKDLDLCWISVTDFPMIEDFILSKIDKKLDVLFDCATVPHARIPHYELYRRLPRLSVFLNREMNNLWITTFGLIRDSVKPYYPQLLDSYEQKILLVDSIFPQDEIPKWMDVPNSATLVIASAIAGGAKKIILFGLDGYKGDISKGINTYYKPDIVAQERLAALGRTQDPGVNRDTINFEERIDKLIKEYYNLFNKKTPIYNCSPDSVYETPKKINYEQLKDILNER